MSNIVDLQFQWVPRHKDFLPNKKVDTMAKRATKGITGHTHDLPKSLRKLLPISITATHQMLKSKIQNRWIWCWKTSPCYPKMQAIDKSTPLKKWLKLVSNLSCMQTSLILQLRTGHIGLNKYLHCIKWTQILLCTYCNDQVVEMVHHFLFNCHYYHWEWHKLQGSECHHASNLLHLLQTQMLQSCFWTMYMPPNGSRIPSVAYA